MACGDFRMGAASDWLLFLSFTHTCIYRHSTFSGESRTGGGPTLSAFSPNLGGFTPVLISNSRRAEQTSPTMPMSGFKVGIVRLGRAAGKVSGALAVLLLCDRRSVCCDNGDLPNKGLKDKLAFVSVM